MTIYTFSSGLVLIKKNLID